MNRVRTTPPGQPPRHVRAYAGGLLAARAGEAPEALADCDGAPTGLNAVAKAPRWRQVWSGRTGGRRSRGACPSDDGPRARVGRAGAQSLRTTRVPADGGEATTTPAPSAGPYLISACSFTGPPAARRGEPKWTVGFFVVNQQTGRVANCMHLWSDEPMNKCTIYPWATLP